MNQHAEYALKRPPSVAGMYAKTGVGKVRKGRGQQPFDLFSETMTNYRLVPTGWMMTAQAMALTFLLVMLARFAMPAPASVALCAVAVAISLAAPMFARVERRLSRFFLMRYTIMAITIAIPMFLFGDAMALWAQSDRLIPLTLLLAAQVTIALVAAITLASRPPVLVLAQTSLWAGFALVIGDQHSHLALLAGAIIGLAASIRQIGHDRAALEKQTLIRRTQHRAEEILSDYEHTGQGWFWETDRKGLITYISEPVGKMIGQEAQALYARPFTNLFDHKTSAVDTELGSGERTLNFHLNARSAFRDLALRAACNDEERYWFVSGRPIFDDFNNFFGFRGSGTDLTEKRRSEQTATRLAHYDSLTGLANRFQMAQTLERILAHASGTHGACTVILIDLDRFKQVNDTMGHPAGDILLTQVGRRLQSVIGDMGSVGRLGGDEFEIILPGHMRREALEECAGAIIARLSAPYSIDGSRVVIGASAGIALAPDDGRTAEALIRNADLALYAAKDLGRGVYHFYNSDLHETAEERRQLEHDLRDAITHGGFELYYQPLVHTASERISGFEALIRWNHPTKGQLSPTKFIPIAEEAGLIAQIGEWALRTACHDLARWPEEIRVAVNVSPLQFASPALPNIVTSALANAGVNPARLELEITESVFLNDNAGTDAMFRALKRLGVRLALDDFGTGYSSLGYLKNAPFDKIKIDQSFVRGATLGANRNKAIIASIVSLAEALGMETTAEGVELLDDLDLMRTLGCSQIQGYVYSQPLPVTEADALLAEGQILRAHGQRSARSPRATMLRRITLYGDGVRYEGNIRNLSETGAMIDGLWNVPVGFEINVALADDMLMSGTVRWSQQGRIGLQFARPLLPEEMTGFTRVRQTDLGDNLAPPLRKVL